ncbi:MAG TPA: serine hydrolase [Chitinophagales bacterium]|nr:serine hydrolase [Chitinophagales bacterium]
MKKNLATIFLGACLQFAMVSAPAQSLDQELADIVNSYQLMGMSVVKVCEGEIDFSKGYGLADFDDGVPVSDSTLYRIASISKSVTATALMLLYDQGLFGLDDDINAYLGYSIRNWHYPNDPITFRMLLSHTSTIVDGSKYDNFLSATYSQNPPPSVSAYFVSGGTYYTTNIFLNKKPGTYFSYSNSNYGLIGTLIEKISGVRFDIFCRQQIFDPLGMTASFNIQDLPNISNVAVLYRYVGNNWVPQADNYNGVMPPPLNLSQYTVGNNGFIFGPQGSLRTSANDLAKFMLLHAHYGTYNNTTILQSTTAQLMHAIQWQFNGSNGNDYYGLFKAWGLGTHVTTNVANSDIVFPDRRMFGHPGEAYGLISDMYFDTLKNGVIFITNGSKFAFTIGPSSSFYTVEQEVFEAVFNDLQNCAVTDDPRHITSFQIVPNPLVDWLSIQPSLHGLKEVQQVRIYDVYGKLWLSAPVAEGNLNVSMLPDGIYQLRFNSESKKYQLPFIKQ